MLKNEMIILMEKLFCGEKEFTNSKEVCKEKQAKCLRIFLFCWVWQPSTDANFNC